MYLTCVDYKVFFSNLSFIYYITVFFLLSRILLYFGLTLINLINSKHSVHLKNRNSKVLFSIFIKLYNNNSLKNNFLKLITVTYL
jgi:cell division protein FtsB